MARRRTTRNQRVAIAGGVFFILGLWAFLAYSAGRNAVDEARAGRAELLTALDDASPEGALAGKDISALIKAQGHLRKARQSLDKPVLAPVRVLPIAGRNLASARALTGSGATLAGQLAELEAALSRQSERMREPAQRADGLMRVGDALEAFRVTLAGADLGPQRGLIRPLADVRLRIGAERSRALALLEDAVPSLRAGSSLLGGPRSYLVLAANNAEMRNGSGAVLAAAQVRLEGGAFTTSSFVRAGQAKPPETANVPQDPDVAARWAQLFNTQNLQSLFLSPRMDVSGPRAAALWEAAGRGHVDGVVVLDVDGLAALLEATGPVDVDGKRQDARSVRQLLLHDQYVQSPDDSPERYRAQAAIAETVLGRLGAAQLDPGALVGPLRKAAAGRHVLAWSSLPEEQRTWERVGAAGLLGPRSLSVGVLNLGSNKLDPTLSVAAELQTAPAGADTSVSLRLTITNGSRPSDPTYINGPNFRAAVEGEYVGIVAVDVPVWWQGVTITTPGQQIPPGPDGPLSTMVGGRFRLLRGESVTITVQARTSGSHGAVRIEPTARPSEIDWQVNGVALPGNGALDARW